MIQNKIMAGSKNEYGEITPKTWARQRQATAANRQLAVQFPWLRLEVSPYAGEQPFFGRLLGSVTATGRRLPHQR
jgi:hypothetical protein